jgi:hemoglobin-like flavoprotein
MQRPSFVSTLTQMRGAEIKRVRDSFQIVERQAHIAALIFYRRLFSLDPSLRHIFGDDIESQADKLMAMLSRTMDLLDQPARLNPLLRQLGHQHSGYGVLTSHYDLVGQALLGMLDDVLGDDFTPEIRDAWTQVYTAMATTMQRGALEDNWETTPTSAAQGVRR